MAMGPGRRTETRQDRNSVNKSPKEKIHNSDHKISDRTLASTDNALNSILSFTKTKQKNNHRNPTKIQEKKQASKLSCKLWEALDGKQMDTFMKLCQMPRLWA